MRFLFGTLLLIGFVSACSTPTKKSTEDLLFDCMKEQFELNKLSIDFNEALDQLEAHYIDEGVLRDTSGKAKVEYYKTLQENQDYPTVRFIPIMDEVSTIFSQINIVGNCVDNIKDLDSVSFGNSTYNQLQVAIQEVIRKEQNLTMEASVRTILSVLDAKAFQHPFYRSYMLLTFTVVANDSANQMTVDLPEN